MTVSQAGAGPAWDGADLLPLKSDWLRSKLNTPVAQSIIWGKYNSKMTRNLGQ